MASLLTTSSGKSIEITCSWRKQNCPPFCPNTNQIIFLMLVNLDSFTNFFSIKTNNLLSEFCSRGKKSKVRLTGTAAAIVTEKKQIFSISKSAKPQCFKHIKILQNRHLRHCRMTSQLFEEWVRRLCIQLNNQDRKIALLINNCPGHPRVENLINMSLFFTSFYYFCVTANESRGCKKFEITFLQKILRFCIKALDKIMSLSKITILEP